MSTSSVFKFQLMTFNTCTLAWLSFQSAHNEQIPKWKQACKKWVAVWCPSNEGPSWCHFKHSFWILVACQSKRSRHCPGPKNGLCILALKPLRKKNTEKRACHFPLMAHSLGPSVTSHGITTERLCQRDDCGMCAASVTGHRSSLAQERGGEHQSKTTEGVYEHVQHKKRGNIQFALLDGGFAPQNPFRAHKKSIYAFLLPRYVFLSPAGGIVKCMNTRF